MHQKLINTKAGLICIFWIQRWDKEIPFCYQRLYYVLEDVLTNPSDSKIGAKGCFQNSTHNKSNPCLDPPNKNNTKIYKTVYIFCLAILFFHLTANIRHNN